MSAGKEAGLTLVEVAIGTVIVAIAFLAIATSMGSNLKSLGRTKSYERASVFMESAMVAIDAQDYDTVLAMNGTTLYSDPDPLAAKFRIDLEALPSAPGLLTVKAHLVYKSTDQSLLRTVTYKGKN